VRNGYNEPLWLTNSQFSNSSISSCEINYAAHKLGLSLHGDALPDGKARAQQQRLVLLHDIIPADSLLLEPP
jgi:hypothetical protein